MKLSIIGPGIVGTTIGYLANKTEKFEVLIGARNKIKGQQAAEKIGANVRSMSIDEATLAADIILLSVPDDSIKTVCESLAANGNISENTVIAHLSGALSSDELSSAKSQCKAQIASLHPLQSFPNVDSAINTIPGTYCYIEGDKECLDKINDLATNIGMIAVEIDKHSKTLYHASAVVACNYLTALMDAALDIGEISGIDRHTMWNSLKPLVFATLDNIDAVGEQKALTGPIVRGDTNTVQKHLKALSEINDSKARLLNIYQAMGLQTANLAQKSGRLYSHQVEEVKKLLNSTSTTGK